MHELAIAQGVLDIAETQARRHDASRVSAIHLEIGSLSCVDVQALQFCFDAVTRGTIAQRATLDIDRIAGEAWCMACGAAVPLQTLGDACPRCGGYQLTVTRGEEMRVKEIEIA